MRIQTKSRQAALLLIGLLSVLIARTLLSSDESGARSPSGQLDRVITQIQAELRPGEAMDTMRRVYSTDRWYTFEKFGETAEYLQGAMRQIGLDDVELVRAPADGVTQVGFWTMPMAWDVKEARLEIVDPTVAAEESVLADYQKVPTSVCEWSGPTPPEGITADVVEVSQLPAGKIMQMDLRGKIALTDANPQDLKWALVKSRAAVVVNGYSEEPSLLDARQWINAWGDNGWAFTKTSTPLPCLSITPREAARVRRLIAEHGRVRLKATVAARYYAGDYPYTTGVIPGSTSEEVLALGHTGEEGAGDNASGVAALMEGMATLNRLISAGRLHKPKRAIRILTMPEMYDSMHYIAANPERIKRTVAAICLDTPAGGYNLAGSIYTFYLNPDVASSYTDAFILKVADSYFSRIGRAWHWHVFGTGTDSYLGEPTIDVPTVWAYSGNDVNTPHHSSADTPDRVDARSLRDLSIVTSAYLYCLANANEPQALWLATVSQNRGYQQILDAAPPFLDQVGEARDATTLAEILGQARDKISYAVGRQTQAVYSTLRLVPEARRDYVRSFLEPLAEQLHQFGDAQSARIRVAVEQRAKELGVTTSIKPVVITDPAAAIASTIVVKRKRFGTIPMDDLPPDQWQGYPSGAWDLIPITALYWCDGQRNLAEVIRLTRTEQGPMDFDFVGYFRFLRAHGYVDFVKGQ
ncbi:MAG TPA: M28 family peptidase [Terriglobia bacterium]|nr:M28 family peptidase [Terriglobia bacterium]